uniref:Uncharacterized protein n=1 Tax=Plectus sambesii TaxID=2011161 RepID=A0A914VG50_9BILA
MKKTTVVMIRTSGDRTQSAAVRVASNRQTVSVTKPRYSRVAREWDAILCNPTRATTRHLSPIERRPSRIESAGAHVSLVRSLYRAGSGGGALSPRATAPEKTIPSA